MCYPFWLAGEGHIHRQQLLQEMSVSPTHSTRLAQHCQDTVAWPQVQVREHASPNVLGDMMECSVIYLWVQ